MSTTDHRLENRPEWDRILELLQHQSQHDVAAAFNVSVADLRGALRRHSGSRLRVVRPDEQLNGSSSNPSTKSATAPRQRKRSERGKQLDALKEWMGVVPDRVLAEMTGLHLNSVRNRRRHLGIPAARRGRPGRDVLQRIEELKNAQMNSAVEPTEVDAAPDASAPTNTAVFAWRVTLEADGDSRVGVVTGASLTDVVESLSDRGHGDVRLIERFGTLL